MVLISGSSYFLITDSNQYTQPECLSTAVTLLIPLEANSILMFPVPENRSSTSQLSKSYVLYSILNKASLAMSVVGLTGKLAGALKRIPLSFPPIIRIDSVLVSWYNNAEAYPPEWNCLKCFHPVYIDPLAESTSSGYYVVRRPHSECHLQAPWCLLC